MKAQKFHAGDLVHVVKDLGQYMSHFPSDCDAIVVGSYQDQLPEMGQGAGPNAYRQYTLRLLPSGNTVSWYEEHQLILIAKAGEHELVGTSA